MLRDMTVTEFVHELGSDSPAPGGGSIAAQAAANAAALFRMVAMLTATNKKYASVREEMEQMADDLGEYQDAFLKSIDNDANSFNGVIAAFHLPKTTEEEKAVRKETIQKEYKNAANVPLSTGLNAMKLLSYAEPLVTRGNQSAITDVGTGLLSIRLAVIAAFYNVKINLGSIKDEAYVEKTRATMVETLETLDGSTLPLLAQIEASLD